MKKVLFISPNNLSGKNGGALGQKKIYNSLRTLKRKNEVDYDVIALGLEAEERHLVFVRKSTKNDILSRMMLYPNYLGLFAHQIMRCIKNNKYDLVILGNSKLGFLAKKIRSYDKNIRIATHFDNIEMDYCDSLYQNANFIKKAIAVYEKKLVKKSEKKSILYSDTVCFLSLRDAQRAKELYKIDCQSKSMIYPVCIEKKENLSIGKSQNIVFVGTLDYASNLNAIYDLIPVFLQQNKFANFIIGGSNPTSDLREKISISKRIILKENFAKFSDVANEGDILVSFIRKGAGMKIKVAEAMSMGLLVCGTKETFVGYESILNDSGLFLFSDENDLLKLLNSISALSIDEIKMLAEKNIALYNENFSMDKSDRILKELIEGI